MATVDVHQLWKLHASLADYFLRYVAEPGEKSGAVLAECVRFLRDNNVIVDGRTLLKQSEIREQGGSAVNALEAMALPFPTTNSEH